MASDDSTGLGSGVPAAALAGGEAPARLRGLETLRAAAAICTIVTHAAVAYMLVPPESMAWPVHDVGGDASAMPDLVFLWCRAAGVKIFFVLAGYFASETCFRRGASIMLASRWKRVGVPLLWGVVTVLPVMFLVWCWGWWRVGYIQVEQVLHFRFSTEDKARLLGLAHLWYLEYLIIYVAALYVWKRYISPRYTVRLSLPVGLTLGAVVMTACMWWEPVLLMDFSNGFVPRPIPFVFHVPLFFIGVLLADRNRLRSEEQIRAEAWVWVVAWFAAQGVYIAWAVRWVWGYGDGLQSGGAVVDILHLLLGVFALMSAVSAVAAARAWRPVVTARLAALLARASYAVYVWHLPLVGIASVLLWKVEMAVGWKMLIATVAGLCIPLAGYQLYAKIRKGGRVASL